MKLRSGRSIKTVSTTNVTQHEDEEGSADSETGDFVRGTTCLVADLVGKRNSSSNERYVYCVYFEFFVKFFNIYFQLFKLCLCFCVALGEMLNLITTL